MTTGFFILGEYLQTCAEFMNTLNVSLISYDQFLQASSAEITDLYNSALKHFPRERVAESDAPNYSK